MAMQQITRGCDNSREIHSGKLTVCYWTWPWKSLNSLENRAIFHSYVSFPEGNPHHNGLLHFGEVPKFGALKSLRDSAAIKGIMSSPDRLCRGSHKWGTPIAGWFIMETPIRLDDLGVPPFQETHVYIYISKPWWIVVILVGYYWGPILTYNIL